LESPDNDPLGRCCAAVGGGLALMSVAVACKTQTDGNLDGCQIVGLSA
jgi:hypothetical protein